MLKRKRGKTTTALSPNQSTICLRSSPKKPKIIQTAKDDTSYEQTTLSQTFLVKPKSKSPKSPNRLQSIQNPPTIQKYHIYPDLQGVIRSYLRVYIKRLRDKTYFSLDELQRSIIIEGPSGCGKTHMIKSLCEEFGLRVLELGVSHHRNGAQIVKVLSEATQTYTLSSGENKITQGSIILLDDVDVVLEPDKGFHKSILELLDKSRNPIIMTCIEAPKMFKNHDNVKV